MSKQQVQVAEKQAEAAPVVTREPWVAVVAPAIDVREREDAVEIIADLPGVDEQALEIQVENGVLTLEGRARHEAPAGYERVLGEFDGTVFKRTLRLSDRIDAGAVTAQLKHGVLRVTLPKRAETKARRVAVSAA